MKKFLGVLGSLMIFTSSFTALVGCSPKKEAVNELRDTKVLRDYKVNSLNNLQGAAALIAKKAILSDQYKYSSEILDQKIKSLNAEQTFNSLNKNPASFDTKDFPFDSNSIVGDLSFRYFGNHSNLNNTKVSENIDLKGRKGTDNEFLTSFIPKDGILGISYEAISDSIDKLMKLLPLISTDVITNLLRGIGINANFLDLESQIGEQNIKYISKVVKYIFEDSSTVAKINQSISKMDIVKESYDLSLTHMTGAMLVSLSNGMTLIKDDKFVPLSISTNNDIDNNLSAAARNIFASTQPLSTKKYLMTNTLNSSKPNLSNLSNYAKAGVEFVKALQFFQMQISMYDSNKEFSSKNGQYLFDEKRNNKKVYQSLFVGKVGDKFASGNINLKYLLASFKYYFGKNALNNDAQGRRLQRLIFILFGDSHEVTQKFEWDWSETGNTVRHKWKFSSKNGSKGANFAYYLIQNYLSKENRIETIWKTLTSIKAGSIKVSSVKLSDFQNLLKGDEFYYLICNFLYALSNDEGVSDGFKGPLNKVLKVLFNKTVVGVTNFPDYLTKNLFTSVYSKNFKSDFTIKVAGVYPVNIWEKLDDSLKKTINNFLGGNDVPMNLKSLLEKPLNSFMESPKKTIWDHYLNKTIPEVIDDVTNDFGINEFKTLKELQPYGIYIDDISYLFNKHIVNNQYYDSSGNLHSGNIISQILENSSDVIKILGINSHGIVKNSLWDFLYKHFFVPNHSDHEVRNGYNLQVQDKRYFIKNYSVEEIENTLNNIFVTTKNNKITLFSNQPSVKKGSLLKDNEIFKKGKVIDDLKSFLASKNKEFWVVNQYKNADNFITVDIEKVILENVNLDFSIEHEVTDHLQEFILSLLKIYEKINVKIDYSKEIVTNLFEEEQYHWNFEMPKVSEEEVLLSQTLKVVYTNSLTSGESIYQFKYSRMTANTPFKFDSIVKV